MSFFLQEMLEAEAKKRAARRRNAPVIYAARFKRGLWRDGNTASFFKGGRLTDVIQLALEHRMPSDDHLVIVGNAGGYGREVVNASVYRITRMAKDADAIFAWMVSTPYRDRVSM